MEVNHGISIEKVEEKKPSRITNKKYFEELEKQKTFSKR